MKKNDSLITVGDYEQYIGSEDVERIEKKAKKLQGMHITHINSTYYGGGVAEILGSLSLLMNSIGIKTGWRIIQGSPDFFSVTKKMHNALQGGEITLTDRKKEIYEQVIYENSVRNHLDHDIVLVHDPQPLWMIHHYKKRGPWIWRCHIDLTEPSAELWKYMKPTIEKYDAVIMSIKDYQQDLGTPLLYFMPAIDPFSIKNCEMDESQINERLNHYDIPTDLPLIVQISRFDRWKDPEGTIQAFKIARKKIDATLVLLGNVATDDPEGEEVYQSLIEQREDRIIIKSKQDTALVNALQRKAACVVQKSIREGFGLTVAEAMWKGTPVIGGNVGGIKYQIKDGENGFLVASVEEAAERMALLIKNNDLRNRLSDAARKTVQKNFLLSRLLEQYLDLFNSFETVYRVRSLHDVNK
ncbi:MAG: glycosyltransferase [Elusimicrobia bacterium]|nr:glycosyltransferase [Elusimicrobiota bacterium]MBD3411909.1 glycosyltransferase [Elusimicrobiota bacterium]